MTKPKQTLTVSEMRKRLDRADYVMNLGAAPLLAPATGKYSTEETEESLTRLLDRVKNDRSAGNRVQDDSR